jgi:hypothetical protein
LPKANAPFWMLNLASLWGGAGGALHVTFCPGSGAETAPRCPVPERSSSTLAGQDLKSRNFPSFRAKREA